MNTTAPSTPMENPDKSTDRLAQPLQNALASLPINLDQELMRYRRAIHGGSLRQFGGLPRRRPQRRALELIQMPAPLEVAAGEPQPQISPPESAPESAPELVEATGVDSDNLGETTLAPYEPQDYLASTEALLNTPEPEPEPPYRPSLGRQLATPLGLGGLLLLLVGSGGLGYLITNPEAVSHLRSAPPAAEDTASESAAAAADRPMASSLGEMAPDLSRREFADLNLSALSALPNQDSGAAAPPTADIPSAETSAADPAAGPAATAPASPSATPRVTVTAPIASPPTARQAVVRPVVPPAASPAPAATPAPAPPPEPETPAAAPSYYYVVADYTGDPSLASARTVVAEAYVRNFPIGARIQLGAFDREATAQQLVQELQSQGIAAQVYAP